MQTVRRETIPLDEILVPEGQNPRTHFDEEALEELARSIERDGLLQPILVRPKTPHHVGKKWELVSGERRLRAHRRLDREEIRAEVRWMDDDTAVRIRLIENVQREDLGELEEAAAYRRMVDELGYDVDEIAEEVEKSASYVYQRLKLLELAEPVREALADGDLTAGHAIEIARLQTPELQERALNASQVSSYHGSGTMSVRDLREWIRQNTHLDLHAAPWKKDDAKLLPQAGPCTTCPKRTGASAELWPEVEDEATCTDPDCYARKLVAYVDPEAERLEEEGEEFVRVSVELWSTPTGANLERQQERGRVGPAVTAGTLSRHDYQEVEGPDACEHTIVGLVVDGGEPGERIHVCRADDCDVHGGAGDQEDPEEARRREVWKRNARERGRRDSRIDRRLAEAVLEDDEIAVESRIEIAIVRLWGELWVDNQKAAAEALGLEAPTDEAVAQWADGRTTEELSRGLLTMALAKYIGGSTSARPPARYGVRGDVLQGLIGPSPEDVEADLREDASWLLPEDVVEGLRWFVPADDDEDDVLGSKTTYHAGQQLQGIERIFCGNGPEDVRAREEEPSGWKWQLCTRCQDHIVDLQTSAMEDAEDGD
jgi:ParB/RepB/Spo0J family partition protein